MRGISRFHHRKSDLYEFCYMLKNTTRSSLPRIHPPADIVLELSPNIRLTEVFLVKTDEYFQTASDLLSQLLKLHISIRTDNTFHYPAWLQSNTLGTLVWTLAMGWTGGSRCQSLFNPA